MCTKDPRERFQPRNMAIARKLHETNYHDSQCSGGLPYGLIRSNKHDQDLEIAPTCDGFGLSL